MGLTLPMAGTPQTTSSAPPKPTSNVVGDVSGLNGYTDGSGEGTDASNSFHGLELPLDGQDSASILQNLLSFNSSNSSREIQHQPDDQFQSLLNAVASANVRGQARSERQDQPGTDAPAHEIAEHEDQRGTTTRQEVVCGPQDQIAPNTGVRETIEIQDQPVPPLQIGADSFFIRTFTPEPKSTKRKRGHDSQQQSPIQQESGWMESKRKEKERVLAKQREAWGTEDAPSDSPGPLAEADARVKDPRALSATVLFKKPTDATTYSRAHMSAVFFELELGSEEFVLIQAAAKQYMLDPDHPERDQCVNPDRDEISKTKLKMWETCTAFLVDGGWGEGLWGADAPHIDEPERTLKWPRDKNKIVKKLIPLLRRQITNARQKKYNREARQKKKNNPQKGPRDYIDGMSNSSPQSPPQTEGSQAASPPPFDPFVDSRASPIPCQQFPEAPMGTPSQGPQNTAQNQQQQLSNDMQQGHPLQNDPAINSNLDQYHYSLERSVQLDIQPENSEGTSTAYNEGSFIPDPRDLIPSPDLKYYVNILRRGCRAFPRLDLAPHDCSGFADLIQHIRNYIGDDTPPPFFHIQVQLPGVLFTIFDENSWRHAIEQVMDNDWMDGEVRFVVGLD